MTYEELKKALQETDDKLNIFKEISLKQHNVTTNEIYELMRIFLSDEEKLEVLKFSSFKDNLKVARIAELISDAKILLKIVFEHVSFNDWQSLKMKRLLLSMSEEGKISILKNILFSEFPKAETYNMPIKLAYELILSLSTEKQIELLNDKNFIYDLKLPLSYIGELIGKLPNEEDKDKFMEMYPLNDSSKVEVWITYSDKRKTDIILKEEGLSKNLKIILLASFKSLSTFIKNNKDFFSKNNIRLSEVVKKLSKEAQESVVSQLEDLNLNLAEKSEILVFLDPDVKEMLKKTEIGRRYSSVLDLTSKRNGRVEVNIDDEDLEKYRYLDDFIIIYPEDFTDEQRKKFIKLCDICPGLQILNTLENSEKTYMGRFFSTPQEYKEAEKWIETVIAKLKPEYTDIQKLAIIENEIGKRISYSPDYETETENRFDQRALWKIISTGYGVCNGISKIMQYILNKVGIASKLVGGKNHVFLKINNITIPCANGEYVTGSTIVDPTWDLTKHRYDGKPEHFCVSYEEIRKKDINSKGKDVECHKNDEELADATLSLDEGSLREVFLSVGLTDKDGSFPIKKLFEDSDKIDEQYVNEPEASITQRLLLVEQWCPEFAMCQMETMDILKALFKMSKSLHFNKISINRVFDKKDEKKSPVLYFYIDLDGADRFFYVADKESGKFVKMSEQEFTKKYECYKKDLKSRNGVPFWEDEKAINSEETKYTNTTNREVKEIEK